MPKKLAIASLLVMPYIVCGQSRTSSCDAGLEVDLRPGTVLRMHVRSGDTDIIGTDSSKLRVACELRDMGRLDEVQITFTPQANGGELQVRNGPNEGFHVRIEVPRNSHLFVRSPAGDLTVAGVRGDKDIELHAGDLTIEVGDPADYARADASVKAGDLKADPFGVRKGGLFRSFNKENPAGKYRLHAHLGAGDLVLK